MKLVVTSTRDVLFDRKTTWKHTEMNCFVAILAHIVKWEHDMILDVITNG